MPDFEVVKSNGVLTAIFNRPHKKNAFTLEMLDQWCGVVAQARSDSSTKVLILTGSGDAFCAGVDLGRLDEYIPTPLDIRDLLTERIHRIALLLDDLDKPTIAAVSGPAIGAGMDLALMCDFRLAGTSARFSEAYINHGLFPGEGGCFYLPRLVGPSKALELLLTGDFVDAEEALRLGLVNRVFADDELVTETQVFAERLATGPEIATRLIKRVVYESLRCDLRTSLDVTASHAAIAFAARERDRGSKDS